MPFICLLGDHSALELLTFEVYVKFVTAETAVADKAAFILDVPFKINKICYEKNSALKSVL